MLSRIQVFLEKNRSWLFSLLLVVIIVPFVFTIGSMPGLVGGRKAKNLKLFGYDLSNQKQLEEVVRNGALSRVLQTGSEENAWMESAQGYAFYRLWLLSIARELRLPDPNSDALQNFIKKLPVFLDDKHQFDSKRYNTYLENWRQRFGKHYTLKSLLVEDYLCDQVRKIVQKTEFILPEEIDNSYKNLKSKYTLDYMVVKNEEPLPEQLHANVIQSYYDKHKEKYRVDQRADVTLLFFDMNKYKASLPAPAEGLLEQYFETHKSQFGHGKMDVSLDEVREEVKVDWETEHSMQLAEEAASQFALQVYDRSILMDSDPWKILLDANDVRCIRSIAPYAKDNIPEKEGFPPSALEKAFDLNEDHFLSDPVVVKNGVVLIALNKFLPPHIPDLETIRERVLEDAKLAERQRLFDEKLERLQKRLEKDGAPADFPLSTLEDFSFENIKDIINLLEFRDIIAFSKDISELKLNAWTKPYKGQGDSVVLFFCRDKKYPENFKEDKDYKDFRKHSLKEQRRAYADTLVREILEATMNS